MLYKEVLYISLYMEKSSKFLKAIKIIFRNEGGYVNNPNDKGGKTNMGITQSTLNTAVKNKITNISDVKNLTRDVCEDIYYKMYWLPSKAEDMFSPIDLIHFDIAVNSGIKNANILFQKTINRLLGKDILIVDGIIGKQTFLQFNSLIKSKDDAINFSNTLLDLRKVFYENIIRRNSSQKVFYNGWMNRIKHLRDTITKY